MTTVSQIKVGKHQSGIVDLDVALKETAEAGKNLSDQQIAAMLVEKISKKNYIPPNVTHLYEAALLREYKKHIGESVQEDPLECIEIKILGTGCSNCEKMEQELMALIAETGVDADLEHVRDLKEISRYGVMGFPALVINRKVKAVGSVPSRSKIKELIREAETEIQQNKA